jgi:hypothetical protein
MDEWVAFAEEVEGAVGGAVGLCRRGGRNGHVPVDSDGVSIDHLRGVWAGQEIGNEVVTELGLASRRGAENEDGGRSCQSRGDGHPVSEKWKGLVERAK